MPGYDRTGPWGEGPRTGGGFGFCGTQARDAGGLGRGFGRGFGLRGGGRGMQRGFRRGFCFFGLGRGAFGYGPRRTAADDLPLDEKAYVKAEAAELRRRLEAAERRLADLEAGEVGGGEA